MLAHVPFERQQKLADKLKAERITVTTKQYRTGRHMTLRECYEVVLDHENMSLKFHVDRNTIWCSIGDGTVMVDSGRWPWSRNKEASAWMLGYVTAYRRAQGYFDDASQPKSQTTGVQRPRG